MLLQYCTSKGLRHWWSENPLRLRKTLEFAALGDWMGDGGDYLAWFSVLHFRVHNKVHGFLFFFFFFTSITHLSKFYCELLLLSWNIQITPFKISLFLFCCALLSFIIQRMRLWYQRWKRKEEVQNSVATNPAWWAGWPRPGYVFKSSCICSSVKQHKKKFPNGNWWRYSTSYKHGAIQCHVKQW